MSTREGKGFPRERIMEPEDLVEAALIGLDRDEIVTADEAVSEAYEAARRGLAPHLAAGAPARRYREYAPAL